MFFCLYTGSLSKSKHWTWRLCHQLRSTTLILIWTLELLVRLKEQPAVEVLPGGVLDVFNQQCCRVVVYYIYIYYMIEPADSIFF